MSLPPFSPLLFSLLPCVKLYSVSLIMLTAKPSVLLPQIPVTPALSILHPYRHLPYGCPRYTNSKKLPKLNLSTLSQDLLLLLYLISQWITSKIIPLAQLRNPGVTFDSTLSLKLSYGSPEPMKKKQNKKQSVRKSEALANVHYST